MTPVDWSRPIEAVHEDGRVVPVEFINYDGYDNNKGQPDKSGDYYTNDPEHERHRDGIWRPSGEAWSSSRAGWRIRNVQPTTPELDPALGEIRDLDAARKHDAALWDRMVALVRRMAAEDWSRDDSITRQYTEARAIVADLPKPVDPDEEAARDVAARVAEDASSFDLHDLEMAALEGIKRGRELAAPEVSHVG